MYNALRSSLPNNHDESAAAPDTPKSCAADASGSSAGLAPPHAPHVDADGWFSIVHVPHDHAPLALPHTPQDEAPDGLATVHAAHFHVAPPAAAPLPPPPPLLDAAPATDGGAGDPHTVHMGFVPLFVDVHAAQLHSPLPAPHTAHVLAASGFITVHAAHCHWGGGAGGAGGAALDAAPGPALAAGTAADAAEAEAAAAAAGASGAGASAARGNSCTLMSPRSSSYKNKNPRRRFSPPSVSSSNDCTNAAAWTPCHLAGSGRLYRTNEFHGCDTIFGTSCWAALGKMNGHNPALRAGGASKSTSFTTTVAAEAEAEAEAAAAAADPAAPPAPTPAAASDTVDGVRCVSGALAENCSENPQGNAVDGASSVLTAPPSGALLSLAAAAADAGGAPAAPSASASKSTSALFDDTGTTAAADTRRATTTTDDAGTTRDGRPPQLGQLPPSASPVKPPAGPHVAVRVASLYSVTTTAPAAVEVRGSASTLMDAAPGNDTVVTCSAPTAKLNGWLLCTSRFCNTKLWVALMARASGGMAPGSSPAAARRAASSASSCSSIAATNACKYFRRSVFSNAVASTVSSSGCSPHATDTWSTLDTYPA